MAGEDAAYAAAWRLAEAPEEKVIAFLRQHLKPGDAADIKKVRRLIGDLDADTFLVRQKVFQQLQRSGNVAVPVLR